MSSDADTATNQVVVEMGSERLSGRAIDLAGGADASTVATAVRDGTADGITVECPGPRALHDHVGLVRPEMSLDVWAAVAAAARSRGLAAPRDDELAAVRARIEEISISDDVDTAAARKRLAGTETAVAECRERAAVLRGRIQAGREADRDVADIREELAETTRELSEHETERAAAREALDQAERKAREARDARERRRRLQDRVANLERAARRSLVEEIRDEYGAAVVAVPGGDADGEAPFEIGAVSAALAVIRVADLRAPVVLCCDRFDSVETAAEWLDASVIRV